VTNPLKIIISLASSGKIRLFFLEHGSDKVGSKAIIGRLLKIFLLSVTLTGRMMDFDLT
jgi:hypothetical protein